MDNVKELAMSVIILAIQDSIYPKTMRDESKPVIKKDARDFIFSSRLDEFIETFGLDVEPGYIRRKTKEKIEKS